MQQKMQRIIERTDASSNVFLTTFRRFKSFKFSKSYDRTAKLLLQMHTRFQVPEIAFREIFKSIKYKNIEIILATRRCQSEFCCLFCQTFLVCKLINFFNFLYHLKRFFNVAFDIIYYLTGHVAQEIRIFLYHYSIFFIVNNLSETLLMTLDHLALFVEDKFVFLK